MFFPLSVKDIVRDPFDPAARIDREISDRNRRLAMGTCLSDELDSVAAALVVATGKGKHLRILNAVSIRRQLSDFTFQLLQRIVNHETCSRQDLSSLREDIAESQAAAIEELKCTAGKYVDRLLVVSATQPDHLLDDQNYRASNIELTNPQLLAERTGLSVVNSFSNRDILAGGSGQFLEALPAWILFADRAKRIASKNRVLFTIGKMARAYFLPASDGIDNDLPEVRRAACDGLKRFAGMKLGHLAEINHLNLDGKEVEISGHTSAVERLYPSEVSKPDFVRTNVIQIVNEISQGICSELSSTTSIDEIVVDTVPEIMGTFANQFRRIWPDADVYDGYGWDGSACQLQPILAATLGILSIDQLPANIPWITGADSQKVLGVLTPGSPANWRQLLREMADFQPPVMRLRDAV